MNLSSDEINSERKLIIRGVFFLSTCLSCFVVEGFILSLLLNCDVLTVDLCFFKFLIMFVQALDKQNLQKNKTYK